MPLKRPVAGDPVVVEDFGQPVYDLVTHPPGRIWINHLATTDGTGGWTTVSGSTVKPSETGARKWLAIVSMTLDQTQAARVCYVQWNINSVSQGQYGQKTDPNDTFTMMFACINPIAISTTELIISGFKMTSQAGGYANMVLIDGGP